MHGGRWIIVLINGDGNTVVFFSPWLKALPPSHSFDPFDRLFLALPCRHDAESPNVRGRVLFERFLQGGEGARSFGLSVAVLAFWQFWQRGRGNSYAGEVPKTRIGGLSSGGPSHFWTKVEKARRGACWLVVQGKDLRAL